MIKTAIILAGGFGTRLQSVVNDLPKPMAPVNGIPFLNYQLNYLKNSGIETVIISTGFLSDRITEYYKNEFNGLKIIYSHEEKPMGTGGGIRLALEKCNEEIVIVLNGDSFFEIDLKLFSNLYLNNQSQISIALRKVANVSRYGEICLGENHKIVSFNEKSEQIKPGLINAGVYIIEKNIYLKNTTPLINFSIEKNFFIKHLKDLNVTGFEFDNYFIDIGIPEDYNKAQNDFKRFEHR